MFDRISRKSACRKHLTKPALGIAAFALLLSATNAAQAATCTDELQRLATDWRAMSFPDVLKPSARILGHDGRDCTGGQIDYMKTEIRLAHVDCGEGREQGALARVNIVRRILRISKL